MQTLWANNSRISRIKNAKFSGCCFFMNAKQYRDFQICCSVPLKNTSNGCFWIDLIIYDVIKLWNRFSQLDYFLTLSWRRPLSYRNQYTDLLRKSMDWFLYDNGLRHEGVNSFTGQVLITSHIWKDTTVAKQPTKCQQKHFYWGF